MSSPSITDPLNGRLGRPDGSLAAAVTVRIQRVAFWAAIALPFLHVPLLATGLESRAVTVAFAVLLACNVLALLVSQYDGR